MANKVEHYYSAAWRDISDYVEGGIDRIPRSMINEDFTLKAEMFTITIAETIRQSAVYPDNFEFSAGELLKFTMNDTSFVIGGKIDSSTYNYMNMTFDVRVKLTIKDLEDYKVDATTLGTQLATGVNWYEYCALDGVVGLPVVGLLWVMQSMFIVAGYTLDVSEVENEVVLTQANWGLNFATIDITYRDFMTYPAILMCINQSVAVVSSVIDSVDNDYRRNKISFFECLSVLLSALSLGLVQTSMTAFKLVSSTSNYIVTDDNNFEYSKEKMKAESDLTVFGIRNQTNSDENVANYGSMTPITINALSSGEGDQITYMMNLAVYITNAKTVTTENGYSPTYYAGTYLYQLCMPEVSLDLVFGITFPSSINWLNTAQKQVRAKVSDFVKETILTNYQSTDKTVMDHNIDMQFSNSEITQETY